MPNQTKQHRQCHCEGYKETSRATLGQYHCLREVVVLETIEYGPLKTTCWNKESETECESLIKLLNKANGLQKICAIGRQNVESVCGVYEYRRA